MTQICFTPTDNWNLSRLLLIVNFSVEKYIMQLSSKGEVNSGEYSGTRSVGVYI